MTSKFGHLEHAQSQSGSTNINNGITIGQVIDTNDPQQMGRVRVLCYGFGDDDDKNLEQIPWAMYMSPLAGITNFGSRGSTESESSGAVAYGMWNIPEIGSHVMVGCIDGDNSLRFYMGGVHAQNFPHTMPHGRYTATTGPLDTLEQPIEPLYSNMTTAFTKSESLVENTPNSARQNLEWRTRGADTQVAGVDPETINSLDTNGSSIADHDQDNFDFTTYTEENGEKRVIKGQGYAVSQLEPDLKYRSTGLNFDSQTYSWTTPAFNSISMDDRPWNNRMRFRTTGGNQIILDDTNERIYISSAEGNTWIELDQKGNIDIYGSRDISMHSDKDINISAKKAIRMQAGEGIHMNSPEFRVHTHNSLHLKSDNEIKINSDKDMHLMSEAKVFITAQSDIHNWSNTSIFLQANNDVHTKANGNINLESGGAFNVNSAGTVSLSSGGATNINAGGTGHFTSGSTLNLLAGSMLQATGSQIHFNGPPAVSAQPASSANGASSAENAYYAFAPSRVPEHEPWARTFSDPSKADSNTDSNTFKPMHTYKDKDVGKVDRDGNPLNRGKYWHR